MAGYPTADTFDSLIDEVITSLQGFGANADQVNSLNASITSSSSTITVLSANPPIQKGIIEIDQELIYVYSGSGTTLSIQPWGRGWKGTTAAAHTSGAAIYVSPAYPRSIVAREVNNTIRAVYPTLFAVGSTDITLNSRDWQYELPAACHRILSVDWKYGIVTSWQTLPGWEMVHSANAADFPTSGKFLAINDPLPAGTILHVTYAMTPSLLVNGSDVFATVTGLPASSRDCIVYGAAARLLPWIDGAHVAQETVSTDVQDQTRPPGTAVAVAKQLQGQHLQRLSEERQALLMRYPLKAHKVR